MTHETLREALERLVDAAQRVSVGDYNEEYLDIALASARAALSKHPAEVRVIDGDTRSADQTSPHAAYCDIALQDSMVEASDQGEIIWIYDDALFDKSLAGNGYKVVSIKHPAEGEVSRSQTEKLWLWRDGKDRFLAFRSLFPTMPDGGDPAVLGQPSGYAFYHPMTLAEAQAASRTEEKGK